MDLRQQLRRLLSRKGRKSIGTARAPKTRRPGIERLEDRALLTGFFQALNPGNPSAGPPAGTQAMMLLSNGDVLIQSGSNAPTNTWFRLSPDATGNYVTGVWNSQSQMATARLFAPTAMLPDSRVFIVGGEYSLPFDFTNTAELYNTVTNSWSSAASVPTPLTQVGTTPPPLPTSQFGDDPIVVLPNGNILAGYFNDPTTYVYNPTTNTWRTTAGSKLHNDPSDEETWIKLADDSILSYDIFASLSTGTFQAQRFIPSQDKWVDASNVDPLNPPSLLSSAAEGFELGPGWQLPDGRVFLLGANGNSAFYLPATNTWTAGPRLPTFTDRFGATVQMGATDNPGAIMPNGKILVSLSPTTPAPIFGPPTRLYEFDPGSNVFTDVTPPGLTNINSFFLDMVNLPTGQVLVGNQGGPMFVYNPDGGPLDSWRPTIQNIKDNGNGTFTLTGTLLTGVTEGSGYGDDFASASNYPILRMTDKNGNIVEARTFNWSSTGFAKFGQTQTTQFVLPAGRKLTDFTNFTVVTNGIASLPFQNAAVPGSISGKKFNDLLGPLDAVTGLPTAGPDGALEAGEPGIQGVIIYVDLNGDGKLGVTEPAAMTDYFGNYTIKNIPPGTNYTVREVMTPGVLQTLPGPLATLANAWTGIVVQSGQTTGNINFGNTLALDFGDAPDSYGTSLSRNGARAGVLPGFGLGVTVGAKPDGVPSVLANTDPNDDGVVLTSAGITPGATASIQVTVNSSAYSPGKLQAWVDFNHNGKFDATEKIISNALLPTGVYNFSFAVPSTVPLGATYARFRYGYEPDLGPTGPSVAGEVEDYALNVLPSVPLANPDSFVVSSTQPTPLNVLANDTPTAFGPPQIVGTDFPKSLSSGTVTYDAVNQQLIFTPNSGTIVPGGSDTFTYRVTDGHSISSPGTVTLHFNIRAVDDTFNVNPTTDLVTPGDINSGVQKTLFPLINDRSFDTAGTVITSVVPETLNTTATATLSQDGKSIIFQAPAGFHGTVIFDYTIQDTGNPATTTPSTARLTVQVADGATPLVSQNYLAELDVNATKLDGSPLPTTLDVNGNLVPYVQQGDQFLLNVTSQDLRPGGTPDNRGVTSAFLDLLLNELLSPPTGGFVQYVTPVLSANNPRGFNIQFGSAYSGGITAGAYLPSLNLINEVGTSISAQVGVVSTPPGPGVIPVFSIVMQANTPTPAGQPVKPASLVGDPADAETDPVEIMTEDGARTMAITDEQVFLGSTAITVLPPLAGGEGEFTNLLNPLDVNSDARVAPSDALTVINTLNTLGAQSLKLLTAAQLPGLVDTNMDSNLSPVDALTIINYINNHPIQPVSLLGGEGEGSSAAAETDLALLGGLSGPVTSSLTTTQSSGQSLLVQTSSLASDASTESVTLPGSKSGDDSPLDVDATAADELFTDLFLAANDNNNGSNLS
jgi:hypothetical protein